MASIMVNHLLVFITVVNMDEFVVHNFFEIKDITHFGYINKKS